MGVENFNVVSFELRPGWQSVPMARGRRRPGLDARGSLVMDHQGTNRQLELCSTHCHYFKHRG